MKACYCGYRYPEGGQCRYRCPPEANPKVLRAQARKCRLNEKRPTRITLTDEEKKRVGDAISRIDPVYRKRRGIALGTAAKSHRPVVRR
jgi:hypothetical protein